MVVLSYTLFQFTFMLLLIIFKLVYESFVCLLYELFISIFSNTAFSSTVVMSSQPLQFPPPPPDARDHLSGLSCIYSSDSRKSIYCCPKKRVPQHKKPSSLNNWIVYEYNHGCECRFQQPIIDRYKKNLSMYSNKRDENAHSWLTDVLNIFENVSSLQYNTETIPNNTYFCHLRCSPPPLQPSRRRCILITCLTSHGNLFNEPMGFVVVVESFFL